MTIATDQPESDQSTERGGDGSAGGSVLIAVDPATGVKIGTAALPTADGDRGDQMNGTQTTIGGSQWQSQRRMKE